MKISFRIDKKDSASHNDRTKIDQKQENYYSEKSQENRYICLTEEGKYKIYNTQNKPDLRKQELKFYEQKYGKWLKIRNEKQIAANHKNRIKTIEEIYKMEKYKPEAFIFQIGKEGETVSKEEFEKCTVKFLNEFIKRNKHVKILNASIHNDETISHVHVRYCFINSTGEPGMNKALEKDGYSLPDPNKKVSKFNNLKIDFTEKTRQLAYECCKELLPQIKFDEEVTKPSQKHKTKLEYECEKLEEQKREIIKDISNLRKTTSNVIKSKKEEIIKELVYEEVKKAVIGPFKVLLRECEEIYKKDYESAYMDQYELQEDEFEWFKS